MQICGKKYIMNSLTKNTNIKGQPHELSYITPQEAGILKMLGGAGKNVNGVPAYYHTPGHAGYTSNRYDTIDYGGGDSLGEGQDTITASTYFKNDKNKDREDQAAIRAAKAAEKAAKQAEADAAAAALPGQLADLKAALGTLTPEQTKQFAAGTLDASVIPDAIDISF